MAVYCPFCSEPISADTSQCPSCGTGYSADTRRFLTSTITQAQQAQIEERRKHFRFYRWHKIVYYTRAAFVESYLTDISTGGLFIQTDEPLRQGEQFSLKISLPDDQKELEVLCEVAWSRREGKPLSEEHSASGMGVKFLNLSPQDRERIIRLLNSLIINTSVN